MTPLSTSATLCHIFLFVSRSLQILLTVSTTQSVELTWLQHLFSFAFSSSTAVFPTIWLQTIILTSTTQEIFRNEDVISQCGRSTYTRRSSGLFREPFFFTYSCYVFFYSAPFVFSFGLFFCFILCTYSWSSLPLSLFFRIMCLSDQR